MSLSYRITKGESLSATNCTGGNGTVPACLGGLTSVKETSNQNPTPAEWKTATDYALMLSDKMLKASEKELKENKCEKQHSVSAA